MTDRIEAAARVYANGYDGYPEPAKRSIRETVAPIIAAADAAGRQTISTLEELRALPEGTILLTRHNDPVTYTPDDVIHPPAWWDWVFTPEPCTVLWTPEGQGEDR